MLSIFACCLAQTTPSIQKASDLMTCTKGWDIYKAGTYRYGPSFITNEDGSIDGWFAASGDTYGDKFYNSAQSSTPVKIRDVKSVGQFFKSNKDFYRVSICCPTWNSNNESVTISVYVWKSSYRTTIKLDPIYTKTVALTDNMWLDGFYSEEAERDTSIRFPAGSYLWVLSDASETAGVWLFPNKNTGHTCTAFQNGNQVSGSYEMITQEPGVSLYWDCPTYQRSTNGGKTWTKEVKALVPTQGSRDQLSACDPGVIRIGQYYYLGYTSTENNAGVDNHLYMARSTSPKGPWEKWNGKGWGGKNPQPIIAFTGNHTNWGCGEPSMVMVDSVLYLYYTWNDGSNATRLATAPAGDENWPVSLTMRGTVIDKSSILESDHCDVKYCDDIGCFIAMHSSKRMSQDAFLVVWISNDGINFTNIGALEGDRQPGLHSCGMTGDAQGHIQLSRPQYIAYAYGIGTWGQWNTYFQPLQFNEALISLVEEHLQDETKETPCYDLLGRPLSPSGRFTLEKMVNVKWPKGIVIKDGKKYLTR